AAPAARLATRSPLRSGPRAGRDGRHFFLQAEDGIRGGHVTGVQTCALPIYVEVVCFHLCSYRKHTTSTSPSVSNARSRLSPPSTVTTVSLCLHSGQSASQDI